MRPKQAGQDVSALTRTLGATHPQHRQLADEVTEDDCAIAGHIAVTPVVTPGKFNKPDLSLSR